MILPLFDPPPPLVELFILNPDCGLLPNEVDDENPPPSLGSGVFEGEEEIWRDSREARRRAMSLAAILARFYKSANDV